VRVGSLIIEALHWGRERGLGQNGGYLRAVDAGTGAEKWILPVYEIRYDPHLEEDVQDLFIRSLQLREDGSTLLVTDEHGRQYQVDVNERKVTPLG
jgi:hypothetical protein